MSKHFSNVSSEGLPRWSGYEAILYGFFGTIAIHLLVSILLQDIASANLVGRIIVRLIAALLSIALCYSAVRLRGQSWKAIGWSRPDRRAWKEILPGYLVYFLVSFMLLLLAKLIMGGFQLDQAQQLGIEPRTYGVGNLTLIYILLVILPAFTEEIIYRGFIFAGLRRSLPFWSAAILCSLLFGVAHGQLNVAIDTFVLGLVLCKLYERHHSLGPLIALHLLKNSISFVLAFMIR